MKNNQGHTDVYLLILMFDIIWFSYSYISFYFILINLHGGSLLQDLSKVGDHDN